MVSPQLTNIEAALRTHLVAATAVPWGVRVPNPRPVLFGRVQRIGGDQINHVQERPLVLLECWGSDPLAAWQLAVAAHKALQGSDALVIGEVELGRRELSSPVNYPDPSTTQDRYQFTAQMTANLVHA